MLIEVELGTARFDAEVVKVFTIVWEAIASDPLKPESVFEDDEAIVEKRLDWAMEDPALLKDKAVKRVLAAEEEGIAMDPLKLEDMVE